MHRIVHVVRSILVVALAAPLVVTGCNSGPGSVTVPSPDQAAPTTAPPSSSDLTFAASPATAGATGIASWVLHKLPDGGQQLQGIGAHGVRFQLDTPRYTGRTTGSVALSVFDDAGHETQGWISMIDGKLADSSLPPGAADFAQRLHDDVAHAAIPYNWSDCSAAQQNEATAAAAVAIAGAAVVAAGVIVAGACATPVVITGVPCAAAIAAATAAAAALAAAIAAESQTNNAMHSACDNLCTSDSWCTGRYGSGWSCNSEGNCEQVTSTICFPCQTVSCGWDFTCVTNANPTPTYCGPCDTGGGGGGGGCEEDCDEVCGGTGLCTGGSCECGT